MPVVKNSSDWGLPHLFVIPVSGLFRDSRQRSGFQRGGMIGVRTCMKAPARGAKYKRRTLIVSTMRRKLERRHMSIW